MKKVTVYVNGEARSVKWRTYSESETLEALGLPPDTRVSLDYARGCFLDFSQGWGFADGHHYVSEFHDTGVLDNDTPTDEAPADAPWSKDADWWQKGSEADE